MSKYFITVTYYNWLAPSHIHENWDCHTGLQTCNGFITMHPIDWISKQRTRAREAWDEERDHTSFESILFYDKINDDMNTDNLQDLS